MSMSLLPETSNNTGVFIQWYQKRHVEDYKAWRQAVQASTTTYYPPVLCACCRLILCDETALSVTLSFDVSCTWIWRFVNLLASIAVAGLQPDYVACWW